MKKTEERKVSEVLEDSLERMSGGESMESCLSSYAGMMDKLEPLLEVAQGVRNALAIEVGDEVEWRVWSKLEESLRERTRPRRAGWLLRWALACGMVVVVLGGLVGVSASSLPGAPLYPLKLATEEVRLAFAFSPEAKLMLEAELVDRRVEEIVTLAEMGDVEGVREATVRLDESLSKMVNLIGAVLSVTTDRSLVPTTDLSGSGGQKPQQFTCNTLAPVLSEFELKGEQALSEKIYNAPQDGELRPALEDALATFRAGYREIISGSE